MRSTRLISAALLFFSCAHVSGPSSQPSSAPAVLYVPVDPKDPSKGYMVSAAAADAIISNKIRAKQKCEGEKLDLQESADLCKAQLSATTVTWWDTWGKPTVVGILAAAVAALTGYEVGRASR